MKKFSQRELLDEGIWNTLRAPAAAIVRGAAKTLDYVAPELTNPINNLGNAVKDIGSSIKKGWQDVEGRIKETLHGQGYLVKTINKAGKNYMVVADVFKFDDSGKEEVIATDKRLLVDENGNRVNTRSSSSVRPKVKGKRKP